MEYKILHPEMNEILDFKVRTAMALPSSVTVKTKLGKI